MYSKLWAIVKASEVSPMIEMRLAPSRRVGYYRDRNESSEIGMRLELGA